MQKDEQNFIVPARYIQPGFVEYAAYVQTVFSFDDI